MKTEENKEFSKGKLIKIDLYSRPNAINGKYAMCQLGLSDLAEIKDSDIFLLETLRMKADLADKIIAEAEAAGENMEDLHIMKELGEKINAMGSPISRTESVLTAISVSLQIVAYFAISIGIWSFIFKKSFLIFVFCGAILGFVISLLFIAPVIVSQRTKEHKKDIVYSVSALWMPVIFFIGVIGLVTLVVKIVFFH